MSGMNPPVALTFVSLAEVYILSTAAFSLNIVIFGHIMLVSRVANPGSVRFPAIL